MSDRDALFAAILAHPDEDTPRLVFADYLDENGESEHAAFIRRQIELARVPEWDEFAIRAFPLDLAVSYGSKWPTPRLPPPLRWSGSPYRRGFPAAVEVSDGAPFLDALPGAFALAPVCELVWWGRSGDSAWGELADWPEFVRHPLLARFRALKLPLAQLPPGGVAALDASPHAAGLEQLDLMTCRLDRADAAALFGTRLVARLTRLALHIVDDGAADVPAAAARLVGHCLRALRLTAGRNHDRSLLLWDTDLLRTPLFRGLQELDLSDNLLTRADVRRLAASGALRGLESLRLNWCRTGAGAAAPLVQSADLGRLRRLSLGQNDLDPDDARELAASPHLRSLVSLNLEKNPIGDAGVAAIARSPHLADLLEIDLSTCAVGDAGAQALLDSPLADRLVRLRLSLNETKPPMKRKLKRRMGARVVT